MKSERPLLDELRALHASIDALAALIRDRFPEPVTYRKSVDVVRLRMAQIAERIAASRGITLAELRGPSRQRPVAWCRQDAMLALRRAGYSASTIGRYFRRDHTTVVHGVQAAEGRERGDGLLQRTRSEGGGVDQGTDSAGTGGAGGRG